MPFAGRLAYGLYIYIYIKKYRFLLKNTGLGASKYRFVIPQVGRSVIRLLLFSTIGDPWDLIVDLKVGVGVGVVGAMATYEGRPSNLGYF